MNLDVLLITNYKAKQLNEFKLLLARTMKLSKTDDWSMHVRTVKDKHWLTIRSGNKKARLLLLALPLMFSDKTEFYNDLNFKAEKYLFTEEWIYGLKDKPGLEQVIGSTNQEFFGRDVHPTVVDKATHLWYSIATKQLFHNGNKRTALLSGITLLNLNFIDLPNVGAKELYNISLKLAEKEMSEVQLKQYILAHAVLSTKFMNLYLDQFSYVNESRGND